MAEVQKIKSPIGAVERIIAASNINLPLVAYQNHHDGKILKDDLVESARYLHFSDFSTVEEVAQAAVSVREDIEAQSFATDEIKFFYLSIVDEAAKKQLSAAYEATKNKIF